MTRQRLWEIVAGERNGILATIGEDGVPQLSNIYYLSDPSTQRVLVLDDDPSDQGPQSPRGDPPGVAPCIWS